MNFLVGLARQAIFAVLLLVPAQSHAEAGLHLLNYAPASPTVPDNILRIYLSFSRPMARGQVRDAIRLVHSIQGEVENPFLNLGVELWDADQRRLTLLFDPGRIKQGVGPNIQAGAALVAGQNYQLIVDGGMKSAAGVALGETRVISYQVVAAERRAISPGDWRLEAPMHDSREMLKLTFDRLIDTAVSRRLIHIVGSDGNTIPGHIKSDGRSWTFQPFGSWGAGLYRVIISPALEDISGNTIRAPFDANSGTIGSQTSPMELTFLTR
ncbi:hypothetical protein EBB79_19765 [Parasedimentitalea marina]|uniref:SbsA Ig-like domain-containing protein n=1 Tax=Parasedimentitalea marina TaxID=2483033 RepID=A0A3T0N7C3_9RHOB|nr:Ig-like domain-containing protein [Parasedimentitalea marina]AZV79897.1 hypothetical protein EBB79_19765 [Parasedimentitalea marina]